MSTTQLTIVLVTLAISSVIAFPTVAPRSHHVKVDPFVALTNTLREEDLQQQHRRPVYHPMPADEADYEKSPIDLWQMRQLQHQMGQAAMMMPFFNREQRNWPSEVEEEGEEEELMRPEDDYGIPVMSEEDGQLFRQDEEPVYSYFPRTQVRADDEYLQEEQDEEEKRLLMDTLAEYLYLSGADNVGENVKRSEANGQKEVSMGSQQKNMKNFQMPQNEQQQQHITNSTQAKMAAEDELIQELDTLKNSKH